MDRPYGSGNKQTTAATPALRFCKQALARMAQHFSQNPRILTKLFQPAKISSTPAACCVAFMPNSKMYAMVHTLYAYSAMGE
jgi:hypothetical protein